MANRSMRKLVYTKLAAALGLVLVLAAGAHIDQRTAPATGRLSAAAQPGIVIDPGHGGYDGGAVWGDVVEKDVNLDISLGLREILLAAGYKVVLTRYGDYSLVELALSKKREDMARRLAVIEQSDPDYFVSIHCNAMGSTRWRGAQAFCQHESELGMELAKDIQSYLREFTDTSRFADSLDHYLLRESSPTGCLVEAGFLSNTSERELLLDDHYRRRIATAIWLGLEKYARERQMKINSD